MKSLSQDPVNGFDPDAVVVSDTVDIAAPASVVWKILIDLPRYNEWNPFCVRAVSTLELGAPVDMMLLNYVEPGRLVPNREYVCAFEPEKRLSWELLHTEEWPYPARRDQIIEASGPQGCRYHSTDAFFGVNGIHVMRFAGPWVKRGFDDTARAVKARAEAMHAGLIA